MTELQSMAAHLQNACLPIVEAIKGYVESKGGYIDTQNLNHEKDDIFAIIYDNGANEYREFQVMGIKVVNGAVVLGYYFIPEAYNQYEKMEWDDYFHAPLAFGGDVLMLNTVTNIAELIEQYGHD